jgi:hypothetical protein
MEDSTPQAGIIENKNTEAEQKGNNFIAFQG